MASTIDEQTPYSDVNGKPLVNGKIFIGTQGLDPVLNPISIFSNRALTIGLANPQTLDADGRSTNKIWVPGKYSLKVEDTAAVQHLLDLDAGETEAVGNTVLSNVQGINTITATASPTLTAYIDKTQFVFTVLSTNTTAVTLNIDGLGAKAIVNATGGALVAGDLLISTVVNVNYDGGNDRFQLIGGGFSGVLGTPLDTNGFPINTSRSTVASSATTSDIYADTNGNEIDFTGTATVTDFPNAPRAGASRILHCAGAVVFTDNATLDVMGGANFTAAAGDVVWVHAITTSTFKLIILRADGQAVVPGKVVQVVNAGNSAVATTTTVIPFDDTIPQNTEGLEAMTLAITPKNTANLLVIQVWVSGGKNSGAGFITSALFQDSTAAALAAIGVGQTTTNHPNIPSFTHFMTAGTISSTLFKVRAGADAATFTLNGIGGVRRYGGVISSSITITEYRP